MCRSPNLLFPKPTLSVDRADPGILAAVAGKRCGLYPNVAKAGGLQSQGAEGALLPFIFPIRNTLSPSNQLGLRTVETSAANDTSFIHYAVKEMILNYCIKNLKAYLITFSFYFTFTAFYAVYKHEDFWYLLFGFLIYAAFVLILVVCIPLLIRRFIFQKTTSFNDSILNGLVLVLGFLFVTFLLRHNGIYKMAPETINLITSIYMIVYFNSALKNLFGASLFGALIRIFSNSKK